MKQLTGKPWQRICALSLSVCLATGGMPVLAYAEEGLTNQETTVEGEAPVANGGLQGTNDVVVTGTNVVINAAAIPPVTYSPNWAGFRGATNNGVTDAKLPQAPGVLDWTYDFENAPLSEPLVVNGNVYFAVVNGTVSELRLIRGDDGEQVKAAKLDAAISDGARPVYSNGLVLVPLSNGSVQALTADTLETKWVSQPIDGAVRSQSTGFVYDGYAYFATTNEDAKTGSFFKIDTNTKETYPSPVQLAAGESGASFAGFDWCGPVVVNNRLIIADNGGTVYSYDAKNTDTGEMPRTLKLGEGVGVESAVVSATGNFVLVSTTNGHLYSLKVNDGGTLEKVGDAEFAATSSCTPTYAGGKVYVGGETSDAKGAFARVDFDSSTGKLGKVDKINDGAGSGTTFPGEISSSPLVCTNGGSTRVYFAADAKPGAIYVCEEGANAAQALYTPEPVQQGGLASTPVPMPDGSVLYANDSGTLFKITSGIDSAPVLVVDDGDLKINERDHVATYKVTQKISEDATNVNFVVDLPEELTYASKEHEVTVTSGGKAVKAKTTIAGQNLTIILDSAEVPSLRNKEVQFSFKAQVVSGADLSKYATPTAYSIPTKVYVTFNEDGDRSYAAVGILGIKKDAEDANVFAPTMRTSTNGALTSVDKDITYTISQQVPDDATSVMLWHDLAPVLHYVSTPDNVLVRVVDGDSIHDAAEIVMDGQRLTVFLADEAPSDSAAESADSSSDSLTAQADDTTGSTLVTDLRGKTIEVSFVAKANDGADFTPYLNEAKNVASVPYEASVRVNEDTNRVATSPRESVKFAMGGSGSGTTRTSTASTGTTRTTTSTPSTGDNTINVTWIVVAAVVVVLIAVALRLRNGRKDK